MRPKQERNKLIDIRLMKASHLDKKANTKMVHTNSTSSSRSSIYLAHRFSCLFHYSKKVLHPFLLIHQLYMPFYYLYFIFMFLFNFRNIGLTSRVFANDLKTRGSLPGRIMSKTQKWCLKPPCLTLSIIIFTNHSTRAGYDTKSILSGD